MISLWRIATDSPRYAADDLSGRGALVRGGRWNEKGTPALYTSASIALACLETLVHLGAAGLPLNRYLVRVDVDDPIWAARQSLAPTSLPVGWDAIPQEHAARHNFPLHVFQMRQGEHWRALLGAMSALIEER